MAQKHTILWVEDDLYAISSAILWLQMKGFVVDTAQTVVEAKTKIDYAEPSLVLLDVMLPPGGPDADFETRYGFRSGFALAKWIADNHPAVRFLACTGATDAEIETFFCTFGSGFLRKPVSPDDLLDAVKRAFGELTTRRDARSFIVHGHDETAKLELKNYLQNTLGFSEPVILHEQPSMGRTLLEKFEHYAGTADLVFVLLTPDDVAASAAEPDSAKRRARQNVIFEMGYFLGRLGRTSGRVLLLHKGPLELPSDLHGVVYIDISNGVASSGEIIRREIGEALAHN